MENKDPIKITSIIITFVIFLAGALLCFWLYTQVINSPAVTEDTSASKIQIDKSKLDKIKTATPQAVASPADGYGRENPFIPYK